MKLTITTEDSVLILAALYEKARRTEEDTGEVPRKLTLTAKKIRRQIRENLKKRRNDKDKRRGKEKNKGKACGDKESAPDGRLLLNPESDSLIRESNALNVKLKLMGG